MRDVKKWALWVNRANKTYISLCKVQIVSLSTLLPRKIALLPSFVYLIWLRRYLHFQIGLNRFKHSQIVLKGFLDSQIHLKSLWVTLLPKRLQSVCKCELRDRDSGRQEARIVKADGNDWQSHAGLSGVTELAWWNGGLFLYQPQLQCVVECERKKFFSRTTDLVAYSKCSCAGKWFAAPCEREDIVFQSSPRMLF